MNDGWSRDEEEEYDDDDADNGDEKRTPTDSAADKEAKHQSKRPPVLINHADDKRIFKYSIRDLHKNLSIPTPKACLVPNKFWSCSWMRSHNPGKN